jgi:hypothetical protein
MASDDCKPTSPPRQGPLIVGNDFVSSSSTAISLGSYREYYRDLPAQFDSSEAFRAKTVKMTVVDKARGRPPLVNDHSLDLTASTQETTITSSMECAEGIQSFTRIHSPRRDDHAATSSGEGSGEF